MSISSGSKEVKDSAEGVFKFASEKANKEVVDKVKEVSEGVGVSALAKQLILDA